MFVPLGNLERGFCLQGTVRDSGRGAPEMEHLWESGGVKEGYGDGHLFPWGLAGKPMRGLKCHGLMGGRRFWDRCLSM
jgi:hypothetical protein